MGREADMEIEQACAAILGREGAAAIIAGQVLHGPSPRRWRPPAPATTPKRSQRSTAIASSKPPGTWPPSSNRMEIIHTRATPSRRRRRRRVTETAEIPGSPKFALKEEPRPATLGTARGVRGIAGL
jgi:hypothetical protein